MQEEKSFSRVLTEKTIAVNSKVGSTIESLSTCTKPRYAADVRWGHYSA